MYKTTNHSLDYYCIGRNSAMAFCRTALLFVAVVAMLALVSGAPAEREVLEQSQPKETLKTANSYGYGYGYGLYSGYPYGYGYHGLYGLGYPNYGYGYGGYGGYGHGLYGSYPHYWW